jgi:hypothetical protein
MRIPFHTEIDMTQGTTQFLRLCAVAGCCMVLLGSSARPIPASLALPGDLPKPLAQMTSGELWSAGNGLGYDNGPVQGRDCARGACMGRIDAVRNQTPGAGYISPNGTIVARLVNLGRAQGGADDGAEARYGMQKDGGARRYYLIALRNGDGWSWTVREATPNGSTPPIETASGTWVTCSHNPNMAGHPKGRSEFASCGAAGGDDDALQTGGPSLPHTDGSSHLFPPRDPGWLTCTDGCCTAGM